MRSRPPDEEFKEDSRNEKGNEQDLAEGNGGAVGRDEVRSDVFLCIERYAAQF
jgi:hypothetical protein